MIPRISKRGEIILFLFLFIFAVFFIAADAFRGMKVYDEGVTIYGAFRVMQGELPYRDFWTVYMPGHYYLYALIFKIFGASMTVERITTIILIMGIAVVTYFITKKVLPVGYCLLVFLFCAVWLSSFDFFGYIIHPTLLAALLSFFFFLNYLTKDKRSALFWSGIFAGLTALFRHDFGFYVLFVEVIILILFYVLYKKDRQEKMSIALKETAKIIAGALVIFLPVAVYFLMQVPWKEMYKSLFVFPVEVYPDYRKIPFPVPLMTYSAYQSQASHPDLNDYIKTNLDNLYLYFPVIVYVAFALQLSIQGFRSKDFIRSRTFWVYAGLLLLGAMFFTKTFVRSLYLHLMPTYVLAILIYFLVLINISKTLTQTWVNKLALYSLLLLAIPALLRPLWSESVNIKNASNKNTELLDEVARASNIRYDRRGKNYEKLITYIDAIVPEGEKIFVGAIRHDSIFTNDVLFYFLSDRQSVTKYHELHPGVATTREVQEEIIQEIAAAGINHIILKEETQIETQNKSGISSGVTLLDDYIRRNYAPDKSFGEYSVWIRKDTAQVP